MVDQTRLELTCLMQQKIRFDAETITPFVPEFEGHSPYFRLLLEESWYASPGFQQMRIVSPDIAGGAHSRGATPIAIASVSSEFSGVQFTHFHNRWYNQEQ